MSSLAGKVVLLTGASSGIGAVTAAHLAQFKPRLVLVGIGMEGLMETSRQCQKNGVPLSQIVIMEKDLTNDAELEVIVQTVLDKFGQLDILINNAGVAIFKDIANTKMADWDRMTAINMRVPFLLTKLCLPHLIKTKDKQQNVD
nr:hypothetical protein BaRGS_016209 [Batillaria attramentaria]